MAQAVSEKKFKDREEAQGQGQITPGGGAVIFYLRIPSLVLTIFCFGTHILNLSESQDSQSYSGKFCNGRNDFLVGLTLYRPSESWDA